MTTGQVCQRRRARARSARCAAFLLLAVAASATTLPAQIPLRPVDEGAQVADFAAFRAKLVAAARRRDVAAIEAALSPEVKLSFGGDYGLEGFRELWHPEQPDTKLWETLLTVLRLGGTFADDTTFTAPYVSSRWPPSVDPFEHVAIIGRAVRVRGAASSNATVVTVLSHAIVPMVPGASMDDPWVHVRWSPTRTGYVPSAWVRSPIDYRMRFVKRHGRWWIDYFLAGD